VRQRRLAVSAAVFAGVTALGACGDSSGTHTQSFSPAPSDSSSVTASTASSMSSPSPTSSFSTPKVAPAAQPAVNKYIALYTLLASYDRDPAHADLSRLSAYLTGRPLIATVNGYTAMKRAGIAVRGTASSPRLRVVSTSSGSTVVLADCPKIAITDPYVEYYVTSGAVVPQKKAFPPPPYRAAITWQLVDGHWKETSLVRDSSKTCTA
jgi:hypothetical protein